MRSGRDWDKIRSLTSFRQLVVACASKYRRDHPRSTGLHEE